MVDETEHGYSKWLTKATIVRAWLLKTIDLYILGMFIELRTTKNIWNSVTQMFYDGVDQSQYYKFWCKATRTKQSRRPVNHLFSGVEKRVVGDG